MVVLDPSHKTHNIPGNFLSYMKNGLPVLASINPGNDLADLIACKRVGKVCMAPSVGDLKILAEELVSEITVDKEIKARCKALSSELFSTKIAVNQIIKALTK